MNRPQMIPSSVDAVLSTQKNTPIKRFLRGLALHSCASRLDGPDGPFPSRFRLNAALVFAGCRG